MKRFLSVIGSLLGLLIFVGFVFLILSSFNGGQLQSKELPIASATPMSLAFQSPIETPTSLPATPTVTPYPTVPPTSTRPPKPSPSPSPVPTDTPIPTPLPLPPSAFHALWVENFPEGQGSVLWLADPTDVANRQEILRFEQAQIEEVALSPNGQQLALLTTEWKSSALWVTDIDGSQLQRLDEGQNVGGPLFWSRNSLDLIYSVSWRTEIILPPVPGKGDTPSTQTTWAGAIEQIEIVTGHSRRLLEIEPDASFSVLGWSVNGQELYYVRSFPQEVGSNRQIWAINLQPQKNYKVVDLGSEASLPILSPDGAKFLIGSSQGLSWMSNDGQQQVIVTDPKPGFSSVWSSDGGELITSYWESEQSRRAIQAIDIHSQTHRDLGILALSGDWQLLSISPNQQWLAAYHYYTGLHWIHLPTEITMPIFSQDGHTIFIAWLPKEASQ